MWRHASSSLCPQGLGHKGFFSRQSCLAVLWWASCPWLPLNLSTLVCVSGCNLVIDRKGGRDVSLFRESLSNAYIIKRLSIFSLSFLRMILKMPSISLGCLLHGTSFTNKTKSAPSKYTSHLPSEWMASFASMHVLWGCWGWLSPFSPFPSFLVETKGARSRQAGLRAL